MVAIPPILVGALVDAVVTGVSKVLDSRLNRGAAPGIGADEVRQGAEAATMTLNAELSQIREAIASCPTTEDLESTIRDLESRIHRALVVQAVGIAGMVAVLLWVLG
ncbi:MAG: hypothetical protein OXH11_02895 [Candidatus Aminicenantes bacterium]|nr:hypothetical protein [Candidatus Aminicenantes bacterium]